MSRSTSIPLARVAARAAVPLLAVAVMLRPAAVRAQCCAPVPVMDTDWFTASAERASPAWVAANDTGLVHVVYREGSQPVLYTSHDGGRTFGTARTAMTEFSDEYAFSLAPDDTLLLGYLSAGMLRFRWSDDDGMSWSPPVDLAPMSPATVFPHEELIEIEARPNGLTALLAVTSFGDPLHHAVFVSADFGRTWSAPLTATSPYDWRPHVALSDTTVAYAYAEVGGAWIVTRRTSDAGRTWGAPVTANSVPLAADECHAIATTADGAFQLAYLGATGFGWSEVRVGVSTDDVVTWDAVNDSVVGEGMLADDVEPFVLPLFGGGVLLGGWIDRSGMPGIATSFSSSRGMPGTWLSPPSFFATDGRSQHDFNVAAMDDGTALVVYDDYRSDRTPACPGGSVPCESIYMSRACPGSTTWEETRLDDDTPPTPTHSEEASIALTSTGRLHVAWVNGSAVTGFAHLQTMAVTPPQDLPVFVTVTPSADCTSATQEMTINPDTLAACAAPVIQWHVDGAPIPGATDPTYAPDPGDIDGVRAWHATVTCGPGCDFRTVDEALQPWVPPMPPSIARTDVPTGTCNGSGALLEAVAPPASECGNPTFQWYDGGVRIFGAWFPALRATSPDFAPGPHDFTVVVTCTPPRACANASSVETVTIGDFVPPILAMTRTELSAQGCQPDRTLLEALLPDPSACAMPSYRWLRDGLPIPGATGPSIVVSGRTAPLGTHEFRYELSCGAGADCADPSLPEVVDVQPFQVVYPDDVGSALRATGHGDPLAADVGVAFEWSRDFGLPRVDDHYHVLRGTDPRTLSPVPEHEPLGTMSVVDSTPAATSRPLVHYYSILAANSCEDVSLD